MLENNAAAGLKNLDNPVEVEAYLFILATLMFILIMENNIKQINKQN